MSGPRKMTAAEYLAERGWEGDASMGDGKGKWSDPRLAAMPIAEPPWFDGYIYTAFAVRIQRARDAEEERDLYRRTFAACVANAEHFTFNDADLTAQKAVDRYRARFAVEVES